MGVSPWYWRRHEIIRAVDGDRRKKSIIFFRIAFFPPTTKGVGGKNRSPNENLSTKYFSNNICIGKVKNSLYKTHDRKRDVDLIGEKRIFVLLKIVFLNPKRLLANVGKLSEKTYLPLTEARPTGNNYPKMALSRPGEPAGAWCKPRAVSNRVFYTAVLQAGRHVHYVSQAGKNSVCLV